jgi:hypothetical protein
MHIYGLSVPNPQTVVDLMYRTLPIQALPASKQCWGNTMPGANRTALVTLSLCDDAITQSVLPKALYNAVTTPQVQCKQGG